jgi:hypothetical protein
MEASMSNSEPTSRETHARFSFIPSWRFKILPNPSLLFHLDFVASTSLTYHAKTRLNYIGLITPALHDLQLIPKSIADRDFLNRTTRTIIIDNCLIAFFDLFFSFVMLLHKPM